MPIPNAIIVADEPVGRATANQLETATTRTTVLTFIPPARAVAAAIGVINAIVPILDMKLVITVVTRQKTAITNNPLGLTLKLLKFTIPLLIICVFSLIIGVNLFFPVYG